MLSSRLMRALVFGLSFVAAPLALAQPAARKAGEIVLERATLVTPEGQTREFELGTLYVPENRAEPKSRLIGVGFARFKSRESSTAPPTFHLPGGPGNSYLAGLKPGENRGRSATVEFFGRAGDVVLVDQRGFSQRGEILRFKTQPPALPLDQPGSLAQSTAAFIEAARTTVAEYAKTEVDLRAYTVHECADDVADLAKALGYPQVTLVGQSFGSQWSFAILRRHPQLACRALLSGTEPLDCGYDMPSHVLAAIQRICFEADQDPRLKPYLPGGGLMAAARGTLERLRKSPVTVAVKDDRTGQTAQVVLGAEDFQAAFYRVGRDTAGPAFLLALYHEQYDAWAREVLIQRRSRQTGPLIGPLIDTSLGVTPRREHLLRTDPGAELLGHWNFDSYLATADIWPTADVGNGFRTEVTNRTPVLFVHGDWDVQTPLENLLQVTPHFVNGRVLVVERGRHGALGQTLPRVPAILEFIRTGSTANLPTKSALPLPQFDAPSFPPPK